MKGNGNHNSKIKEEKISPSPGFESWRPTLNPFKGPYRDTQDRNWCDVILKRPLILLICTVVLLEGPQVHPRHFDKCSSKKLLKIHVTSFSCSTRNSELHIFLGSLSNYKLLCQHNKMCMPLSEIPLTLISLSPHISSP